jgi:hypothetical protein
MRSLTSSISSLDLLLLRPLPDPILLHFVTYSPILSGSGSLVSPSDSSASDSASDPKESDQTGAATPSFAIHYAITLPAFAMAALVLL